MQLRSGPYPAADGGGANRLPPVAVAFTLLLDYH